MCYSCGTENEFLNIYLQTVEKEETQMRPKEHPLLQGWGMNGFSDVECKGDVAKRANEYLACWSRGLVVLILPFQPPTDGLDAIV